MTAHTLLYCQCEAQNANHWAFQNWRRYFNETGWSVIDFDYEIEALRLGREGMWDILLKLLRHEHPDMIWHGLYQDEFSPQILEEMHRYAPMVGFASDDSWRLEHSLIYAPSYTRILTTESSALPQYREVGATPVLCRWAVHPPAYPVKRIEEKPLDVVFIGQALPYRIEMARRLRERDVRLVCSGKGWREAFPETSWATRPLVWKEMIAAYAHSRIVLGMCQGVDGQPQIKARHVEIPALCHFHLVNHDDHLSEYFDLTDVPMWTDEDDLIEKILYYLHHPEERQTIARKQYTQCITMHTWAHRISDLMTRLL